MLNDGMHSVHSYSKSKDEQVAAGYELTIACIYQEFRYSATAETAHRLLAMMVWLIVMLQCKL